MSSRDDYLFAHQDSHSLQEHQRHHFQQDVAQFDGNRLLNSNIDDLVSYFVEKYKIEVPELDEASMQADQHEARRDVSGDPNRMAYIMRSGPTYAVGTEVIVEIPFTGDAGMFKIQPSTYNSNPPQGEVRGNL